MITGMLDVELLKSQNSASKKLIVVLHGLGDSREGYRWLPTELDLPDFNYLLVNAPDPYYSGFSWFDLEDPLPGMLRSRQMLLELLAHYHEKGYPSPETVLFGFSQGCMLTLDVGFRHPHPLGAMIGISGSVFDGETLLKELSPCASTQKALVTHGTSDPIFPLGKIREQINRLRAQGLQITWNEFDKGHTIAGRSEVSIIRSFILDSIGTS